MPNPNAVVSTFIRLDPPLDQAAEALRTERGVSVELEGGRRVRLSPADPRSAGLARVLDELRTRRRPVYLEIDPATLAITRLLIPHVTRILGLRPAPDGSLDVELERSHARHRLRRDSPDFGELQGRLRDALGSRAQVILTETDAHDILDVRGYTPGPDGPLPPFPEWPPRVPLPRGWIRDLLDRLWRWRLWPWWWFRCISMTKAQQVFDAMSATSCNPLTVPPPCIPFLYPDDGCWGRAHEMCRLMIDLGLKPRKVWIDAQTGLHADTKNHPQCFVEWGWHVAPILCVRGGGTFLAQDMVIDPSLFTTPVSKATWKAAQGDPNATLTDSDASIFYLWWNTTDPTYTETNAVLADYRLYLQARSVQIGPPPYVNCP
jgi:hypothetical protein